MHKFERALERGSSRGLAECAGIMAKFGAEHLLVQASNIYCPVAHQVCLFQDPGAFRAAVPVGVDHRSQLESRCSDMQ